VNREQLERPFDRSLIKTRKGQAGRVFSYVEGSAYIARLNEALDGEWSFEVIEHKVGSTEVIVLGKLSTNGVTKMAFGGSSITVSRDGEIVSVADDLKAAATDALKKASSMLGVGLHLYSDAVDDQSKQESSYDPASSNAGRGRNGINGNGDRATQKQIGAIWAITRRLGIDANIIRTRAVSAFGSQPEFLTKADASSLIDQLNAEMAAASAGNGSR